MTDTRNPAVWQVSGGPVDRPYAEVFVNGRSKGTTPVTLSVTAGRYKVTLQRSGGASWEAVRQVEPGKTTRVSKRWRR